MQKDGDSNSNSLLPPVKYNSRAHSRLDNPRSLCMKTYYAAGSLARTEPLSAFLSRGSLLFSVEHDKSNYTFKLRYTILSPSFSFLSLLAAWSPRFYHVFMCSTSFCYSFPRIFPPSLSRFLNFRSYR